MAKLFFQERGRGYPVILLHGFPFHQKIWDSFAEKLSENFRVVTVDLPGFGRSPSIKPPFTIDQVGDELVSWIEKNKLSGCALIGHSLGGYIALAVAHKKPSLLSSLALFHSTAYPDSAEKKISRNKVLEFIDKNGVESFTSNFIAPLFVDQQHPAISQVRAIAVQATTETVKGYTAAMRDREDRTDVLKSFNKPILIMGGENDPGISVDSINTQTSVCSTCKTFILLETAHMGMFEKEKECLSILQSFILKTQLPSY
jgi:pimeloyl-ACP methyl ester carboxylesterase